MTLRDQPIRLTLLGRFSLTVGESRPVLSPGPQRLLAFLALRGGAVKRAQVAGALWPEATEARAYGSLRSELWRLQGVARHAIDAGSHELRLAEHVRVDLRESFHLARRLLDSRSQPPELDVSPVSIAMLSADLLPDWHDEWVLMEAEHWRQLRLHALEALSARFRERGRYGEALDAAFAAVVAEPLRESANRAVIEAHLAEGNQSEGIRTFERYRDLLRNELGLDPTNHLERLLPRVKTA